MIRWNYDRHEILVDGIVHALGVVGGLVAVIVLLALAAPTVGPWELTSVAIYGSGLLAVLVISAVYNLWPVSPVKWVLRRFDHSAIYLLIAGTYTPFIMQMRSEITAIMLLVGVWAGSLAGMVLKLCLPGRFDRLAILLYLLLGWSGVMAYEAVLGALPGSTLALLAAGGLLYTVGVIFHVWEGLRFHNAIWHAFVLVAAACHYGAVLDCVVLARG
ncbi:PAQR family membrane homeostasis protein TrhA [Microvirga arsenatis]|uniref:Hemolysin III family protein n=1 Tax=Microvirga arsenatis TaxID=2692265 RepID=A0ABW9Z3D2_9HYPH|nr:hemolysin III family protein [Microvirga arsenatis]NBJ13751.1 hemolysin III family protein [Microvirga arsenatis]NBJ27209.1 hemolysin III family protein [Microvirga arsenatis]